MLDSASHAVSSVFSKARGARDLHPLLICVDQLIALCLESHVMGRHPHPHCQLWSLLLCLRLMSVLLVALLAFFEAVSSLPASSSFALSSYGQ